MANTACPVGYDMWNGDGKTDMVVHVHQYAFTKDGRTIFVDEIIEEGKLYRGRNIDIGGLPVVELKHEEISHLADEICKAVTIE